MSTITDTIRFIVSIPTGDTLDVRELAVHERLSGLFSIRLTVVSDNPDIDFEAVIGRPAGFEVRGGASGGERLRSWTGICRELDQLRVEERGLSTYSLEIVPTLWLATQRRNHRMFQGLSDVDVALAILSEWGIEPVQQLSGAYKKRKYRVQYGEPDYDFFCRMLEDAGVTFSFVDQGGTTALVLSDAPHQSPLREPKIAFRDTPTVAELEHVTAVRVRRQVRPGKVTLRDHDYRRQPGYKLLGAAALGSGVEDQLEQFHYTPGAFLFESNKGDPTPAADDRGRYRTDEGEAQAMARRRLDGSRSEALSCTFDTNALDLAPGVVLSMLGHPQRDLGEDRRLLVVASSLIGTADARLQHHCEAHRADVPYRPLPATPRPRVMGVESATVVGPAGEEIHTDEFGRVRVHFHWDRESRMDEKSSCWIHVSQSWGGAGYGGVNLPRIGQEVLVDFLGGDPDRPIITGRVYTNLQKVPYALPASKTQSGWKSNSTNATGGYNEMMFEDAAGQELLRMQAEKDLHKLVKNDEESNVGRDRTRSVQRNESVSVGKSRTKQVAENEQETIGQNHRVAVGVNRSTEVGTHDVTRVGHTHVVMIAPPGEGGAATSSSITMTDKKIVLDTGAGATIVMDHDKITITADDLVEIWGKKRGVNLHAPAPGGKANVFSGDKFSVDCKDVSIKGKDVNIIGTSTAHLTGVSEALVTSGGTVKVTSGGPNTVSGTPLMLNGPGLFCARVTEQAPMVITTGAALVLVGGPSFPLPVVVLADGSIQVGKNIRIINDPNNPGFTGKVLRDLGLMASTPSGAARLQSIDDASHKVTIDDNKAAADANGGGATQTDPPGNRDGTGSDAAVHYDPDLCNRNNLDPDNPKPADANLFHELTHANNAQKGITDTTPLPSSTGWDTQEEKNVTAGGSSNQGPNENDYLRDRGYPYNRTNHHGGYEKR